MKFDLIIDFISQEKTKIIHIHPDTEGFIFAIQDRVINTRNYKKHMRFTIDHQ
jgi:hypothetical protein